MANDKKIETSKRNDTDVALLSHVCLFPPLIAEQFKRLLEFEGIYRQQQTIEKRLRTLEKAGLVQTLVPRRADGSPYPKLYFFPDDRNVRREVGKLIGGPVDIGLWKNAVAFARKVNTGRAMETIALRYQHNLTAKNFILGFEIAKNVMLCSWSTPTYSFQHNNRRYRLEPDAFVVVQPNAEPYPYLGLFLEVETTRKPSKFIEVRVNKYLAYLRSKTYKKELEYFPTVLFVFDKSLEAPLRQHSQIIRESLMKIDKDLNKWKRVIRFGAAYADDYYSLGEPGSNPFATMWFDLTDKELTLTHNLISMVPEGAKELYSKKVKPSEFK